MGLWFLIARSDSPSLNTAPPELFLRSGGEGTTMASNERSFSLSNRAMGLPERIRFAAGDVPFEHIWSMEDGLGDSRNGNSWLGLSHKQRALCRSRRISKSLWADTHE